MKFNVSWLADILQQPLEAQQLATQLTAAGLEVDTVTAAGEAFSDVVIAKIVACEQHPDADRLRVCSVDYGQRDTVQIVCGAPNAVVGLVAPLAKVGAVLPGDFKIKPAKLRGIESQGMLCSGKELGLDEDASGLLALMDDAPIGESLRDWMHLDDQVIEIELTPNRADCLSLRGLAREVSALQGQAYVAPEITSVAAQTDAKFDIKIKDYDACPRYAGRIIEDLNSEASSPIWMQERLRRCGLRSKSPLVDVTNYILLEMGQPLHAFDVDKLKDQHGDVPVLGVRTARAGEKITLLNDQAVTLKAGHLLVTANDRPEALAGVMGGVDTAITDTTTSVLLESAWFSPAMIMGRSRDLGLTSDAAYRFERGIDPTIQIQALERATELLIEIAGGKAGPICTAEMLEKLPQVPTIRFRLSRCNALLGLQLDATEVSGILTSLGMQLTPVEDNVWQVSPPAARLDIALEVDLIEEVARVHGFEHIPDQLPAGALMLQAKPEKLLPKQRLEMLCVDQGYQEVMTYSFIDRDWLTAFDLPNTLIELANPISQELAIMRPSLMPGLVAAVQRNLHKYTGQQRGTVRLFEIGTVFNRDGKNYQEQQHLAFAACGRRQPEQWQISPKNAALDFFDFKGDVETALAYAEGDISFKPSQCDFLHPGQSADIFLTSKQQGTICKGWLGLLHPGLRKKLGLDSDIFVAELQLDLAINTTVPKYQKTSKFPAIRRDLALIVPEQVGSSEVLECIRKQLSEHLQTVFLFDVYTGAGVESGYKSLAIGLILQDDCQTLTDDVAEKTENRVLSTLKEEYGIRRRD